MQSEFGAPVWATGIITALLVAAVIVGGISRIGKVTGVLAPLMAAFYVAGAMFILIRFYDQIIPSLALVVREAFNPSAGVAGTGAGAFVVTMMWGVRRGLFSNEAGQGSAPIAHAAAKTDEPVSEGVVALLEPFIDTIVICTMTALAIIVTSAWDDRFPTEITLGGGAQSYLALSPDGGFAAVGALPETIEVTDGVLDTSGTGDARIAWNEVVVDTLYADAAQTQPFSGAIYPTTNTARGENGVEYAALFGNAVENGAPLTMVAFRRGLPGNWGQYIVVITVLLFALSTAIAWSYYGDRCAFYLFGEKAVLPYKVVFVLMHFVGAVVPLSVAWTVGDIFLGIVILPNLLALVILTPKVKDLTDRYFQTKPWIQNAEDHRRAREDRRRGQV
jgi:AGCS family alanine or glycine:cation symporter